MIQERTQTKNSKDADVVRKAKEDTLMRRQHESDREKHRLTY